MPNIQSAKKRHRQSLKRNLKNSGVRNRIRTTAKNLLGHIENKENDQAKENLSLYFKYLDKAVVKGIIKKNNAARKKSAFAQKVKNLTGETAPAQS